MHRKEFIKNIGLAVGFMPFLSSFGFDNNESEFDLFFENALLANQKEIIKLKDIFSKPIPSLRRSLGFDLANLTAAYVEPKSAFYKQPDLVIIMQKIVDFLASEQKPDGTLDFGNLSSPPDTAFIIDPLCAAARIIKDETSLKEIHEKLKSFIIKAADQLSVGGVHTPNHRWVVSAALAKTNALYPNKKYEKRINEWLAEKVFQDQDGVYLERSITYAEVVNRSLIFIAQYHNRPDLLKLVSKSLQWLFYMMEPNGDMVTVQSRRQDAFHKRDAAEFYIHYRYMAIKNNDGFMGAVAKYIETMPQFAEHYQKDMLYYIVEDHHFRKSMPISSYNSTFEQYFKGIELLRKRNNDTSSYLFAGADWPIIVASGRSTNPNIFGFRKGNAILNHVRLSTSFFSTGYFRGKGIKKTHDGYLIEQIFEAPYYQPLPKKYLKEDGDYALSQSTDGRFWNKMDFKNRPQSNQQKLHSSVLFTEKEGKQVLKIDVNGPAGVKVVIELCFDENGQLDNKLQNVPGSQDHFLKEGYGTFTSGSNTITFGPGIKQHESIKGLEGELYSTHFGTLKGKGKYVFLTGICPFSHTLEIY